MSTNSSDGRYERGLETRREVLGSDYVDRALERSDSVHRADPGAGDRVLLGSGLDA